MNPQSDYGMAIGNLTAQAASNFNLNDFDNFVEKNLKLTNYVRYVDDIVIVSNNKKELINNLYKIIEKLKETNQTLNKKKTKIETAYHGVPFLGKVSYPYGYQKAKKTTIIRIYEKAKNIEYESVENLLAMTNSQIGTLKKYNCRKLILNYSKIIKNKMPKTITFNEEKLKFEYTVYDNINGELKVKEDIEDKNNNTTLFYNLGCEDCKNAIYIYERDEIKKILS